MSTSPAERRPAAPGYPWICGECQAPNTARANRCAACRAAPFAPRRDFSANGAWDGGLASAAQSMVMADVMLFFPEIIPAALVAVSSPFWLVVLLVHGHFLSAFMLAVGVGAGVCGFFAAVRDHMKFLAWFFMLWVLVAAYVTHLAAS